jgi:hypothetical protein
MTRYRIVCTEQEPVNEPARRAHIVAVGTNTNGAEIANERWTLQQVLELMDRGHEFYTQGLTTGKTASVKPFVCPYCSRRHLKSAADSVTDNNLDSLRFCRFN